MERVNKAGGDRMGWWSEGHPWKGSHSRRGKHPIPRKDRDRIILETQTGTHSFLITPKASSNTPFPHSSHPSLRAQDGSLMGRFGAASPESSREAQAESKQLAAVI